MLKILVKFAHKLLRPNQQSLGIGDKFRWVHILSFPVVAVHVHNQEKSYKPIWKQNIKAIISCVLTIIIFSDFQFVFMNFIPIANVAQ